MTITTDSNMKLKNKKLNTMKLNSNSVEDFFALTPMQEGMLYHHLQDPHSHREFEQLYLEISGTPDIERFKQAWKLVVSRNQMLRTLFRWETLKQPIQIVLKEHEPDTCYVDLSSEEPGKRNRKLEELIQADRSHMFDLAGVPFRLTLCILDSHRFGIIVSNHHILYDGWSNGIILKEFFDIYERLSMAPGTEMTPSVSQTLKAPFKDFVRWLQHQDSEEQKIFWDYYLDGFEGKSGKFQKRKRDKDDMEKFQLTLSPDIASQMESLARYYNISLSAILYGAWGILLQKVNKHHDILYDTTVSGRSANVKAIENTVGLFINTLPIRVCAEDGDPLVRVLHDTYERLRRWQKYENTSQVIIKECLSRCPQQLLFDSLLVIENYPLEVQEIVENSEFSILSRSTFGKTVYDLTVLITISDDIQVEFGYGRDFFPEELINMLSRHFISVVQAIITNPEAPLFSVDAISPRERVKLLRHFCTGTPAGEDNLPVEYPPPSDPVEWKLREVWAGVLNIPPGRIDRSAGFFDFDNHSLKAAMLVAAIHKTFSIKVPLAEIFARPTLEQQADYIKEQHTRDHPYLAIQPIEAREYYPVSSSQRRFFLIQRLSPDSTAYNTTSIIRIQGQPDAERLEAAFQQLIRRHQSLRTSFQHEETNGTLVQRIHDDAAFHLEHMEWTEEEIDTMVAQFSRPFDLSVPPLLRAALVKLRQQSYLLIIDIHHIVADGSSRDVLVSDFAALYNNKSLPPLSVHYKDFSHWQERLLRSGLLEKQKHYWLDQLSLPLPRLNLATDFPRPATQSLEGDRIECELPPPIDPRSGSHDETDRNHPVHSFPHRS